MHRLRVILLTISAVGAALFASAFVVSFVRPMLIESMTKELVRREIEARVGERIASLQGSRLARLAQRAIVKNDRRMADLASELPKKVAAVVAEMQDSNCGCRKVLAGAASSFLTLELLVRSGVSDRLLALIRGKYAEVTQALLREFRIFTGANALVFLLLGITTYTRRRAGLQLLLPAIVLLGAALVVGTLYLFGQDWVHTIVFSSYVGLGYFAYLVLAVAFLLDVVFNHGRISTEIVNAALNAFGGAIQAAPC
jgi:hypothetical protein